MKKNSHSKTFFSSYKKGFSIIEIKIGTTLQLISSLKEMKDLKGRKYFATKDDVEILEIIGREAKVIGRL